MNSVTEWDGEEFGTTMALGYCTTSVTGTKSGDRVVAEFRIEIQVDGLKVPREKNGVTVGGGARGGLGCEIAAGSAPVLDDDLLAPRF
jgi:hypothetical protein